MVGGATARTGRTLERLTPFSLPVPRPATIKDPELRAAFLAARDGWEKQQDQLTLDISGATA